MKKTIRTREDVILAELESHKKSLPKEQLVSGKKPRASKRKQVVQEPELG